MIELLRSNNPVVMSFAASLLHDAGIQHTVADSHMSVIEGSISALPSRLLVADDHLTDARDLLIEAGIPV